jgi:hypothetical protein
LTLPRPSGPGALVGFGFDGDGDELHLVPTTVSGDAVQLKVWHFSGAGTLTATLGELSAVLGYQTTRAHGPPNSGSRPPSSTRRRTAPIPPRRSSTRSPTGAAR